MKNPRNPSIARGERGSIFVFVLVLLFAALSLSIAGLIGATETLKVSSNYKTGMQAQFAAEAGALHAQKVVGDMGVVTFANDIISPWATVFGTSARAIPGYSQSTYAVTPSADPVNPAKFMLLTSVGAAPNEASRSVTVRLKKTQAFSPGAIYMPANGVDTTFNGNSFYIDGVDHQLNGTLEPNASPVPGIATYTDQAATDVIADLSVLQYDNVVGSGTMPSVLSSPAATTTRIINDIVPNILGKPSVVTNPNLTGNDTFGTTASPQITHFTGDVTITGNLSGAGILIVDQGFTISGSANFVGLIIVRGQTQINTVSGNAAVLGALWTTNLSLTVSGSASVTYSTDALALADGIDGGDLLPQKVRAVAWKEDA
jgi:hypothetical protein